MMTEETGVLATPAKKPPIPTSTNEPGFTTHPGATWWPRKPNAPPSIAPMKTDGPKTPPLPPDPMVQEVPRIFRKARRSIVHQKIFPSRALWIHPSPPPETCGNAYAIVPSMSPHTAGFSILWIQMALEGKMFWWTMLLLAFLKILGTSCTIGSGGSGGVFGPSVFIGAMLGGAFGFLGHQVAPGWVVNPGSFVLVGIGGFFAGVARTPVSSVIMACEMSASYTLLVQLMLVSSTSYLLLRNTSL